MSVVAVHETKERQASINEKFESTYSHTFLVQTDDPYTSPADVRNSPGITVGQPYPYDSEANCTGVSATCTSEDGLWWTVTVEYGPWEDKPENPLDEPYEVEWGLAQNETEIDEDVNGKPIVNAAGDPFLEAVKRDDPRAVLRISRNEATFSGALAYRYRNVVNRDPFFGAPKGTVKVLNIGASRQFDQKFGFFWRVTYEFEFRLEGWKARILNVGMREKVDGKRKNILVNGVPINDPMPLDKEGKVLPVGTPPIVLDFQRYQETSFSVFNF